MKKTVKNIKLSQWQRLALTHAVEKAIELGELQYNSAVALVTLLDSCSEITIRLEYSKKERPCLTSSIKK